MTTPNRARELFDAALDMPTAEVDSFLDSACGTDADLRRRVAALLVAHARPDPILDRPAAEHVFMEPIAAPEPVAPPGYALAEEVGRGGMGVVYRARDERLGRDVAVKQLRPELPGGSSVVARFMDEARVTARLQHPGIPPVHQVGELHDGRPFLAMKLIQGHTLVELLASRDREREGATKWLAVFEAVCQAVGYAHSRGVIHRDLKPANVMVGAFGEVQVMDWGLAKEVGHIDPVLPPSAAAPPTPAECQADTWRGESVETGVDRTRAGSVMGTPGFMAPEQARGDLAAVDRRADVFGLGAVLCVLLTGHPPFRGGGGRSALDENAAGDLTAARAALAGCGAEAELIALCERCLHTDPAMRPADAGEVAAAVAGFRGLADERARRAELDRTRAEAQGEAERKRRQALVAAGVLVMVVLSVGTGVSVWQAIRATDAEGKTAHQLTLTQAAEGAAKAEAENARVAEKQATESAADTRAFSDYLVNHVLAFDRPAGLQGGVSKDVTLTEAVRAAEKRIETVFAGRPKAEAAARHAVGVTWRTRGNLEAAERQLRRAVELRKRELGPLAPDTLDSLNSLAVVCDHLGRFDEAVALTKECLVGHRQTFGPDHVLTLSIEVNLGYCYITNGRFDEAVAVLSPVETAARIAHGPTHDITIRAAGALGVAYVKLGRLSEAEPLLTGVLAARRATLGNKHPQMLVTMDELATIYRRQKRYAEAGRLLEESLATSREVFGDKHSDTLSTLTKLATLRTAEGKYDEAEKLLDEALPAGREALGADHPNTLGTLYALGTLRDRQGRRAETAKLYEEVLAGYRKAYGPNSLMTIRTARNLAAVYLDLKQPAKAAERFADALAGCADRPADDPEREFYQSQVGFALVQAGKAKEAEPPLRAAYTTLAARKTPSDEEKARLRQVLKTLADVCDATDRATEAAGWREKLKGVK